MPQSSLSHADDAPAVSIWYIRQRLGKSGTHGKAYSGARMARYLALLIDDHGFPPPFPCLRRVGGVDHLVELPCEQSSWPRDAVDQWFADYLLTNNANAIDAAAMREAAHDMDRAAFGLRLVRGGRGDAA